MHFRLTLACLVASLLITGCPGGKPKLPNLSLNQKPAAQAATTPQSAARYALFNPQTQVGSVPVAWSLSYDGTRLLGLAMDQTSGKAWSWDLTGPAVGEPDSLGKRTGLRAFIAVDHNGSHALTASLENTKQGAVDVFWLFSATGGAPRKLDYASATGLPTQVPPGSFEGNSPLFSGDGKQILLPIKTLGIVVLPTEGGTGRFVPLPSFGDVKPESVTLSVLPAVQGKQYVCASLAAMESMGQDYCQLQFLDLATLHWDHVTRFNKWLPLVVGTPDFRSRPWVQLGSRPREIIEEPSRTAKIAMFDPVEQIPLEVPFLNDTEMDDLMHFRLDSTGEHLVCFDHLREAVVRYGTRDGLLEIDPRIYLPQAQLHISRDSEVVLLIQDNLVMRVEFSQTEDLPGYADDSTVGA